MLFFPVKIYPFKIFPRATPGSSLVSVIIPPFQLPKFFYLCEDGVWGVRKACAEAFMPVSCVCSAAVRHSELSPLFVNLLRDESRWVKVAAFQALGHFISTFADSAVTGLLHNDNGEIIITDPEELAKRLDELEEQRTREAVETAAAALSAASEEKASTKTSSEKLAGDHLLLYVFSRPSPFLFGHSVNSRPGLSFGRFQENSRA